MLSKFQSKLPASHQPSALLEPQMPQPENPQLPTLTCLGNEVIAMIADLLHDTSPHTISSLALVCSNYYSIARYTQNRELLLENVKGNPHPSSTTRLAYIEKTATFGAVRRLEVRNDKDEIFLPRLCRLIPKMTGLTDVVWSKTEVPERIVELLRERPSIHLHAEVINHSPARDPEIIDRLQANENLVSLNLEIIYRVSKEGLRWSRPFKHVVLSCPNLRKLRLDICRPQPHYGLICSTSSNEDRAGGFGFVNGERLPALEELDIINYPFGIYEDYTYETSYWADNFDWSRLLHLATNNTELILKVAPHLTSLKEFHSSYASGLTMIFLNQVPSALESIAISRPEGVNGSKSLLEAVLVHRQSLKRLTIHQKEDYYGRWEKLAIDIETLTKIRDGCPHIEELGLDLYRDDGWPYKALRILASFPRLCHLKLYFQLGIADEDNPTEPYVTFSAAGKLFRYLQQQSIDKLIKIQTLEIKSGFPPSPFYNDKRINPLWHNDNSSNFICTLSDRHDAVGKEIFSVRCTNLNREQNEYLRKVERGEEDSDCPYSNVEAFRVARDGPTPYWQSGRTRNWRASPGYIKPWMRGCFWD
ncbi:uncharacterized protein F4822DRAFT_233353 [Hypoxylon trugodes]|uniref:uncharacterized protein n=1 Tax=Hypoxylon trugodes TaxID=326681 RepID=UPI002190A76D|nr:uncharacterized protein F4822DRAFT_233353 [Hypoxylon trugodes]KAI1390342.1 hypothetical protein F4822DRAFT_233353 [Hypoxylon trugodes]